MKKYTVLLSVILLLVSYSTYSADKVLPGSGVTKFTMPAGLQLNDYLPKTIVFKVKTEFRGSCTATAIELNQVNQVLASLGKLELHKMFANAIPPSTEKNEAGFPFADLSLIYEFTYSQPVSLEKAINNLLSTGMLQYAEPKYLPKVFYTPNDPSINFQYFLGKIQAYNAWNISKGDTTVVIGITDTGTDTNHPDLAGNLKHNYGDPVNGIDDDGDTYIDNFSGWDLGENDNDAQVGSCGTCAHGSHVSGCAAAVTDNNTGVASPGFYSKFLPVKIADANGSLTKAYEGIVYAADHGCQIINCSWGGGGGGQLGQDAITYASINKNALVVAAAGNNGSQQMFFPSSYQYVLSVASTDDQDKKSSFSNYDYTVDVCAPGSNIYSTIFDNSYTFNSGTSMASPVAAGAAAVVKSFYPTYNGLQVGEQLRVTADFIDNLQTNTSYYNKLGGGRINLFRALTENGPAVRLENKIITDNNDGTFIVNDTLEINGDFINFLAPTTNLVATISTNSPYATIIDNSTTAGIIPTLGIYNNVADPFKLKINASAPINAVITIRVDLTDGAYTDFQYFTITVNVDYINVTVNAVSTTVTSKGRIGYNNTSQAEGLGFAYNGDALMYEGGLMIGNSNSKISDIVRGDPAGSTDADFQSAQTVHPLVPSLKSEFDLAGIFNDNLASQALPILVNHNFYVWSTPGNTKYVIFEYHIKNNGTNTLNALYAGIYADFDIGNSAENIGNTDLNTKMGYCYNTAVNGYYAGIKVLTPTPFIHFATDNDGGNGGISNYDGFSTAEKYQTLSTNHATAGGTGTGADVSNIVSTGPFSVNAGDVVTVAFALIAGDDLNDLINSATNAQVKYDGITGVNEPGVEQAIAISSVYPNPIKDEATLTLQTTRQTMATAEVFDALGRKVYSQTALKLNPGKNKITLDLPDLESGLYSVFVQADGVSVMRKFIVSK